MTFFGACGVPLWVVPEALWDFVSRGMMGSLSSSSLSDFWDSSSDQGLRFFTFLVGVPLGTGVFFTLGAPAARTRQKVLKEKEKRQNTSPMETPKKCIIKAGQTDINTWQWKRNVSCKLLQTRSRGLLMRPRISSRLNIDHPCSARLSNPVVSNMMQPASRSVWFLHLIRNKSVVVPTNNH